MAKRRSSQSSAGHVSRADLERRFAAVQSGLQGKMASSRSTLVTVGTIGGIVLLLLVFVMGKRSGKRKTTFVEIRRV